MSEIGRGPIDRSCGFAHVFHSQKTWQGFLRDKDAKALFASAHRLVASNYQLVMVDYIVIQNHDIVRKFEVPFIFSAIGRRVTGLGKFPAEIHLEPRGLWPPLIPGVSNGIELSIQG